MHLFVYGSLTNPRRLDQVIGRAHRGERLRARLAGFESRSSADYDYPFLVPATGSRTDGILVMDLTESDIRAIDAYEEVHLDRYRRAPVEVEAWGRGPRSRILPAETYVAGPMLASRAQAPPWA